MSITTSGVRDNRDTLANRFAAYLATTDSPTDIGVLVRNFDLSLRAANKSQKLSRVTRTP
jgi:hypothetical protein